MYLKSFKTLRIYPYIQKTMASYNPPLENVPIFNPALFTDTPIVQTSGGGTGDLTKAQADTYYLSKILDDTSTATLTTFQSVDVNSTLKSNNITGIETTGVKSIYTDTTSGTVRISAANGSTYLDANNVYCASNIYCDTYNLRTTTGGKSVFGNMTSGNLGYGAAGVNNFFYGLSNTFGSGITTDSLSLNTTTGTKNIFTNGIAGAVLNIGSTLGTNTINGNTTLSGNTSAGGSNSISSNFFYFQSATGTKNLFTTATTASINYGSATCTTSFSGVTTFNQEVKIPTRLTLKGTLYVNEVKTITGTSATLTFPLEDTTMLTSNATTIDITLPLITTSTQAGLTFAFFKTASTTNSVIFTASGTNQIWINSSITNGSPLTDMGATKTETAFMILEVSAGIFVWKQI